MHFPIEPKLFALTDVPPPSSLSNLTLDAVPFAMLAPALLALAALLPTSLAHFHITSPSSRDNDEDTMGTFPCGGPALVSSVRTPWPLQGGPIQLDMEHGRVAVQVLLAMGSDPGVNFNTVILPTIQEEGPGDFCIGAVVRFLFPPLHPCSLPIAPRSFHTNPEAPSQ